MGGVWRHKQWGSRPEASLQHSTCNLLQCGKMLPRVQMSQGNAFSQDALEQETPSSLEENGMPYKEKNFLTGTPEFHPRTMTSKNFLCVCVCVCACVCVCVGVCVMCMCMCYVYVCKLLSQSFFSTEPGFLRLPSQNQQKSIWCWSSAAVKTSIFQQSHVFPSKQLVSICPSAISPLPFNLCYYYFFFISSPFSVYNSLPQWPFHRSPRFSLLFSSQPFCMRPLSSAVFVL